MITLPSNTNHLLAGWQHTKETVALPFCFVFTTRQKNAALLLCHFLHIQRDDVMRRQLSFLPSGMEEEKNVKDVVIIIPPNGS